jgi:hypothetical protein
VLVVIAASSLQQTRERLDDIDRYLNAREFELARVLLKTADTVETVWEFDS